MLNKYRDNLKVISYYAFFGLMLYAKGIGLDSGDKFYYILSVVAGILVMLKILLTQYTKKQMVLILALLGLAFVTYRNSGRLGIVLSMLAIVGMKDINIRKLFRMGAIVYSVSFFLTVSAAALGWVSNSFVVHEKGATGEVIRWGMGYSTGNIFHVSYFILVVLLCYSWRDRYKWKHIRNLMIGNLMVFLFSLSYTGVVVTSFYLFLLLYILKCGRLGRIAKILCQFFLPFCIIFSLVTPLFIMNPFVAKIDVLLQARLSFSAYYLQNQPFSLLGSRMKEVPNFWVIMDNSYVYFLMTFGIIAFALFVLGYALLIKRYCVSDENKKGIFLPELAIIFAFLLYGIMEQFLSNAFMNVSLLFMGEVLWGKANAGREKFTIVFGLDTSSYFTGFFNASTEEKINWKKTAWKGAMITACACVTFYFLLVPMATYIPVPLDALNKVNAQCLEIRASNQTFTKEILKKQMKVYKVMIGDEKLIQACLDTSTAFSRITVPMVQAALEFSLPQYVYNSKRFNVFRVRLLQLYWDVPEETCERLLFLLNKKVEENMEMGQFSVVSQYNAVIGKSFGSDRIEHIDNSNSYYVEKTGNIVKVEYYRSAVLVGIGGFILGFNIVLIWKRIRNYLRKSTKKF